MMNLLEKAVTTLPNGIYKLIEDPDMYVEQLATLKTIATIRKWLIREDDQKMVLKALDLVLKKNEMPPVPELLNFISCSLDEKFIGKVATHFQSHTTNPQPITDDTREAIFSGIEKEFWSMSGVQSTLNPDELPYGFHLMLGGGYEMIVILDYNYTPICTTLCSRAKQGKIKTSSCNPNHGRDQAVLFIERHLVDSSEAEASALMLYRALYSTQVLFFLMSSLESDATLGEDVIIKRKPSKQKMAKYKSEQKKHASNRKTLFLTNHFILDPRAPGPKIKKVVLEKLEPLPVDASPVVTHAAGDSGASWTLDHEIEVRGHFKNIRCGPGRSLTKRVWIDAFVKGAGLGERQNKLVRTSLIELEE